MAKIAVIISYTVIADVPNPASNNPEEQWLADWHADIMDNPDDFLDGKSAELTVSVAKFSTK